MGKNEQHYESSISGPPHVVDGPGCVPVAVGAFLATSGLCAARSHDTDGTQLYCNKELAHVAMGDPWHNMVPAGTLGREAAERVLRASGALERDDACQKCRSPYDPSDTAFDGRAQQEGMPFCRSCVDRCMDTEIADHWCVVDQFRMDKQKADRDAFLPCTHPLCGKSPIEHIGLILGHQYVEPK